VTDDAGTETGTADGPSRTLVAAGAVLVAVLVALLAALLVGGETGATVAVGSLGLVFAAIGVGLFRIARRVGSKADDPEEVERRLGEGLGLSEEQIRVRTDRVADDETVPSQQALDERFYDDEG
jgi:hypothetical protein